MDCKHDNMTHMTVRIDERNNAKYRINAKAVKIEQKQCKTYVSFVGAKITDKASHIVKVNSKIAKHIITQNTCIEGSDNVVVHPMINDYRCEYSYLKHLTTTTNSCHHFEGTIFVDHKYNLISGIANMAKCVYEREFCATSDGTYVMWKRQPEAEQEFVNVGTYNATLIGAHLAIPELAMTLKVPGEVIPRILNRQVWDKDDLRIQRIDEEQSQVKLTSDSDIQADVDRKLQYIMDVLNSPRANQKFNCDIHKEMERLKWTLINVNPTIAARTLLKKTEIVATATESYLMVYPCSEVYQVTPRSEEDCWVDTPVKYRLNEQSEEESGFVNEQGVLLKESLLKKCRDTHKYLQLNNSLYRVSKNNWDPVHQNVVKDLILISKAEGIGFPDDYPDKAWISNGSESMQTEDWIEILRDTVRKSEDDEVERYTPMAKYPTSSIIIVQWILIVMVFILTVCEISRKCKEWCTNKLFEIRDKAKPKEIRMTDLLKKERRSRQRL